MNKFAFSLKRILNNGQTRIVYKEIKTFAVVFISTDNVFSRSKNILAIPSFCEHVSLHCLGKASVIRHTDLVT